MERAFQKKLFRKSFEYFKRCSYLLSRFYRNDWKITVRYHLLFHTFPRTLDEIRTRFGGK